MDLDIFGRCEFNNRTIHACWSLPTCIMTLTATRPPPASTVTVSVEKQNQATSYLPQPETSHFSTSSFVNFTINACRIDDLMSSAWCPVTLSFQICLGGMIASGDRPLHSQPRLRGQADREGFQGVHCHLPVGTGHAQVQHGVEAGGAQEETFGGKAGTYVRESSMKYIAP